MRSRGRTDGLEGGGLDLHTRRDDDGAAAGKSKAKSAAVAPLALLGLLAVLLVLHFARSAGGADPPPAMAESADAAASMAEALKHAGDGDGGDGGGGAWLGIVEEHHHVLAQYVQAVNEGRIARGERATVLHIDSHADMGVPDPFEHGAWPSPAQAIERTVSINDFLLQAVRLGLVEHIIFVEPPWGNQFRCCFPTRQTWRFAIGEGAADGALRVDVLGGDGDPKRERFGHVFWRDGERRVAPRASLRNAAEFRFTILGTEDAREYAAAAVHADGGRDRPLILDIDLDNFSTESPGAIRVRDAFAWSDDVLETLYHVAWDFPPLGEAYMRARDSALRDASSSEAYVAASAAAPPAELVGDGDGGTAENSEWWYQRVIAPVLAERHVGADRRAALARLLAPGAAFAAASRAPRDEAVAADLKESFHAFVEQPFHIADDDEIRFLVDEWRETLRELDVRPAVIHLVRSPSYLPQQMLHQVECPVLEMLRDVYGVARVHHEPRVDPWRAACDHDFDAGHVDVKSRV